MRLKQLLEKAINAAFDMPSYLGTLDLHETEIKVRVVRRDESGAVEFDKIVPVSFIHYMNGEEFQICIEQSDLDSVEFKPF